MKNFLRKKKKDPAIRDILFGDAPLTQWPEKTTANKVEPWQSFIKARELMNSGNKEEAV